LNSGTIDYIINYVINFKKLRVSLLARNLEF
jgi:hypothetical protein